MTNPFDDNEPLLPPTSRGAAPGGNHRPRPVPAQQPAQPRPVAGRPQPIPTGAHPAGTNGAARPVPAGAARPGPAGSAPIPVRPIPVKKQLKPGEMPDSDKEDDGEQEEEQTWAQFVREAPAWLISATLHMTLLIILGMWAVAVHVAAPEEHDISAEAMTYAEQLGDQLSDQSAGADVPKELQDPNADKQVITPQDMAPVDDPFAAPLPSTEIALNGSFMASDVKAPVIGNALMGRQSGSSKTGLLGKYGGNKTTESAVLAGLAWLAKQQRADGMWSLTGPYSNGAPEENTASATAMALLAFQGQGQTHQKGEYKENVAKGWRALIKQQNKDGDFFRNGPAHQRLYTQAQCTIAVCELYGMTQDSSYRLPAELATKYAVRIQDKQGGWRYTPGEDSDTSVTGWFVMALQSAKMAKLEVPQATFDNIMKYLDSAATNDGMSYTYTPGSFSSPAVTAEGLLCREYLGWKQSDPRLVEGTKALLRNPVTYDRAERDVYYWYYATQATHHMEGEIWSEWNKSMRQEVPSHQIKAGPESGSWDPDGDKWGTYGGRLYVTCLSIYMLEVYYRHLPIYSGYKIVGK